MGSNSFFLETVRKTPNFLSQFHIIPSKQSSRCCAFLIRGGNGIFNIVTQSHSFSFSSILIQLQFQMQLTLRIAYGIIVALVECRDRVTSLVSGQNEIKIILPVSVKSFQDEHT